MLDVGTNNEELLADPEYVGLPEKRLEGDAYFDFVDEFMDAVFDRWPNVVVQFEDFETPKALPLLSKYRDTYRCFNDDIQGTGCVTLAGILSAAHNAGSSITEMKFLCAGAGSAGLGVCAQIVDGMVEAGLSREEAMSRFVVCSSVGAIGRPDGTNGDPNHKRGLNEDRAPWVNQGVADGTSMLDVVKEFQPTCLLGLAAQPAGLFTEDLVRSMTTYCERPIIMPMSNPTPKAECTPQQAYEWTDGKAVVATGSPFKPVTLADGRTLIPSQVPPRARPRERATPLGTTASRWRGPRILAARSLCTRCALAVHSLARCALSTRRLSGSATARRPLALGSRVTPCPLTHHPLPPPPARLLAVQQHVRLPWHRPRGLCSGRQQDHRPDALRRGCGMQGVDDSGRDRGRAHVPCHSTYPRCLPSSRGRSRRRGAQDGTHHEGDPGRCAR